MNQDLKTLHSNISQCVAHRTGLWASTSVRNCVSGRHMGGGKAGTLSKESRAGGKGEKCNQTSSTKTWMVFQIYTSFKKLLLVSSGKTCWCWSVMSVCYECECVIVRCVQNISSAWSRDKLLCGQLQEDWTSVEPTQTSIELSAVWLEPFRYGTWREKRCGWKTTSRTSETRMNYWSLGSWSWR